MVHEPEKERQDLGRLGQLDNFSDGTCGMLSDGKSITVALEIVNVSAEDDPIGGPKGNFSY